MTYPMAEEVNEQSAARFSCLLCHGDACTPVLEHCRDLYVGFGGSFNYVKCTGCNVVQLHPVPTSMADYYRSYPVHRSKTAVFSLLRAVCVANTYYRIVSAPKKTSTVVDFGCGDGWYAERLRRRGHDVVGYEPDSKHAHALSERLAMPVFADIDSLLLYYAGRCDVVTMHFVLEHMTRPADAFRVAAELLKPGGTWYFIIPNINSKEFKLFGRFWHGFDVPRHVTYLTPSVVRELTVKHSLVIEQVVETGSVTDFAGTVANLICGRYQPLIFYASIPLGIIWSRFCRQACHAYTIRKP